MGLWSSFSGLFRKKQTEERLSLDQVQEMIMKYQGTPYLLGQGWGLEGSREEVEGNFLGYVHGAYRANGVVFACMLARMHVFSEMRFQYQALRNGRPGDYFSTPALGLLERPWPTGSTGELLSRAIQDVDLSGNHYVVKEVGRLRRLRPDWVSIILTDDPTQAVNCDVAGYMYQPGGIGSEGSVKYYLPEEVAHWAPIPDPEAQYRGISWLTPILREVQADKAATAHKAKFFENAATPNIAVSLKDTVTQEQFKEFIEIMDREHGGVDNAYKTLYLGGGADVTVIGADMQQMDFKKTQGLSETRIAAAARVHPVIVGLSEGMQGSALNAGNFQAAKDSFGDGTIRPLWRSLCAVYAQLVGEPPGSRLWFDDRDVAFLLGDRKQLAEIQRTESATIESMIRAGFMPDSIIAAVLAQDWGLMEHSGLFSVQLLPPNVGEFGPGGEPTSGAEEESPDSEKDDDESQETEEDEP